MTAGSPTTGGGPNARERGRDPGERLGHPDVRGARDAHEHVRLPLQAMEDLGNLIRREPKVESSLVRARGAPGLGNLSTVGDSDRHAQPAFARLGPHDAAFAVQPQGPPPGLTRPSRREKRTGAPAVTARSVSK